MALIQKECSRALKGINLAEHVGMVFVAGYVPNGSNTERHTAAKNVIRYLLSSESLRDQLYASSEEFVGKWRA